MIRIAHISDLHFCADASKPVGDPAWYQKVVQYFLEQKGIRIEIHGHAPERLEALHTRVVYLRPDIIVVTGDISTYGDRDSLAQASATLRAWAAELDAGRNGHEKTLVLCVPGNHDALQERFAALKRSKPFWRHMLTALEAFEKDLEGALRAPLPPGNSILPMPHLANYTEEVEAKLSCRADPAQPVFYSTPWGSLCFFLFNSVNDPGWMANEGRCGPRQYNRLNTALTSGPYLARDPNTLQFALLHHHPLPIPYMRDSSYERFFNAMQDGSTLCHFLNECGFHFVLHGHQHQPYDCQVLYRGGEPLNILAAGTATQAGSEGACASFNVLDVQSPFQVILRRFQYRDSGFAEMPDCERTIEFEPECPAVFKPGTTDEQDFRNWLRPNPIAIEREHSFELISLKATVENNGVYHGTYRLKGQCLGKGTQGIRQVVTGSPEMEWSELQLVAWDTQDPAQQIGCALEDDQLRQKCFSLVHPRPLVAGDAFDYSYRFQWKNLPPGDTYFDGFSLYPYEGEVGRLEYSIDLPWKPLSRRVEAVGLKVGVVQVRDEMAAAGTGCEYSFAIDRPKKVAYLIHLPKRQGPGMPGP
jgi:3',5'-cyclic AMP phosphodiesterase CpdA